MFLLISQRDNILRYSPSEGTNLGMNLKLTRPDIKMARFNLMTNTVYFIAQRLVQTTIRYLAPWMKTSSEIELCKPDAKPLFFTIDFLSNTLYWTDESDSSISFVHLPITNSQKESTGNGTYSTQCGIILQHEDYHPTKIMAVPEEG